MRQFVKLSDIEDKFAAIGVSVGGMTTTMLTPSKHFITNGVWPTRCCGTLTASTLMRGEFAMRNMAPVPLLMVFPIRA